MGAFSLNDPIANLSAVTATGAGSAIDCRKATGTTWVVTATNVTSGATVKIQGASSSSGTFYDVATVSVTANGASVSVVDAPHAFLRANITARTDGTYTVECLKWTNSR